MHTGPPKAPLTRPYTHTEASGTAAKGPKQNAQTYRLSSSMCDITRPLLLSSIVSKCARRCAARAHVLKHLDRGSHLHPLSASLPSWFALCCGCHSITQALSSHDISRVRLLCSCSLLCLPSGRAEQTCACVFLHCNRTLSSSSCCRPRKLQAIELHRQACT